MFVFVLQDMFKMALRTLGNLTLVDECVLWLVDNKAVDTIVQVRLSGCLSQLSAVDSPFDLNRQCPTPFSCRFIWVINSFAFRILFAPPFPRPVAPYARSLSLPCLVALLRSG